VDNQPAGNPGQDRFGRALLVRRVVDALRLTAETVLAAVADDLTDGVCQPGCASNVESDKSPFEVRHLQLSKVVGEAALLLRCVAAVSDDQPQISQCAAQLAKLLIPYARGGFLLTGLCLQPELALDHSYAHILLRDLGYPDPTADLLLAAALADGQGSASERLPTRELEQLWLRRIWSGTNETLGTTAAEMDVLARCCIRAPLEALGTTSTDIYSFTHLVLYASDTGRRSAHLPRSIEEITADAEAALVAALDGDNYDLAAESIWVWPMLGAPWSATAAFGFQLLMTAQDEFGFLPGPGYASADRQAAPEHERRLYVLRSSYHTTLVMGILCAAALKPGCAPPGHIARSNLGSLRSAAVDPLLRLLQPDRPSPRWLRVFRTLDTNRQADLAPFLLGAVLRRARYAQDLSLLRKSLAVALKYGLADGPIVVQAVSLLRRSTLLADALDEESTAAASFD
jgi:hypothetical protein